MSITSFKPEHVKGLHERENAFRQLEKLGTVWIGPDVAIEKTTVVLPGTTIRANIVLNKKDLPQVELTRGAFRSLQLSVRSFYAQTGIDVRFHGSDASDTMLKSLKEGKSTFFPVSLENLSQRAVEVSGEVFRFFWVNDSKRLRRKDLVQKIKSGEFAVDGVEGEDWFLRGYEDEDKFTGEEAEKKAVCVAVRLTPKKFYIPYAPLPVRKDSSKSTRENLSHFLQQIPEGSTTSFEIGETPRIKLGPNIVGVICTQFNEKDQKHIHSPLIDSGSDWPIRTETLHGLEEIDFFLYEK